MLEAYWKVGFPYYKEYKNTLIGYFRARIKFALLPPCCKAGAIIDDKIIIGSFRDTNKVFLAEFYSRLPNQEEATKIKALEGVLERYEGKTIEAPIKSNETRLRLLEELCTRKKAGPPCHLSQEIDRLDKIDETS